jgi:hypothetical protein
MLAIVADIHCVILDRVKIAIDLLDLYPNGSEPRRAYHEDDAQQGKNGKVVIVIHRVTPSV